MGPQQVTQLQVSHNFAMWLLAAIKQKKKSFFWILISFKAFKIFLSLKKMGGKGTIEFSKKFTWLFNQQDAIALLFYGGFLVTKKIIHLNKENFIPNLYLEDN